MEKSVKARIYEVVLNPGYTREDLDHALETTPFELHTDYDALPRNFSLLAPAEMTEAEAHDLIRDIDCIDGEGDKGDRPIAFLNDVLISRIDRPIDKRRGDLSRGEPRSVDGIGLYWNPFWRAGWHAERVTARDPLNPQITVEQPGDYTYEVNLTGNGVDYLSMDSGVDQFHFEFNEDEYGRKRVVGDLVDTGDNGTDDRSHGTGMIGSACGRTNSFLRHARIVSVKVFNGFGSADASSLVTGINAFTNWYINDGKRRPAVMNNSWGGTGSASTIQSAFAAAVDAGIICVASAGNNANQIQQLPSEYNDVIGVMAANIGDKRAGFSTVGSHLQCWAPGREIPQASKGNTYFWADGTSPAGAIAAGVAAGILQGYSGLQNRTQVEAFYDWFLTDGNGVINNIGNWFFPASPRKMVWLGDRTNPEVPRIPGIKNRAAPWNNEIRGESINRHVSRPPVGIGPSLTTTTKKWSERYPRELIALNTRIVRDGTVVVPGIGEERNDVGEIVLTTLPQIEIGPVEIERPLRPIPRPDDLIEDLDRGGTWYGWWPWPNIDPSQPIYYNPIDPNIVNAVTTPLDGVTNTVAQVPTDPVSGNMLLAICSGGSGVDDFSTPLGWTPLPGSEVQTGTTPSVTRIQAFYKVSDGTETTADFAPVSGSLDRVIVTILQLEGFDPDNPFITPGTFSRATASTSVEYAQVGATDTMLLIGAATGADGGNTFNNPANGVEAYDSQSNDAASTGCAQHIITRTAPADGNYSDTTDMTIAGHVSSIHIGIVPLIDNPNAVDQDIAPNDNNDNSPDNDYVPPGVAVTGLGAHETNGTGNWRLNNQGFANNSTDLRLLGSVLSIDINDGEGNSMLIPNRDSQTTSYAGSINGIDSRMYRPTPVRMTSDSNPIYLNSFFSNIQFEDSALGEWIASGAGTPTLTSDVSSFYTYESLNMFVGTGGADSTITQTQEIPNTVSFYKIDQGEMYLYFEAWFAHVNSTTNSDAARVRVQALAANDSLLGDVYDSGNVTVDSSGFDWSDQGAYRDEQLLPNGTRKLRIIVDAIYSAGTTLQQAVSGLFGILYEKTNRGDRLIKHIDAGNVGAEFMTLSRSFSLDNDDRGRHELVFRTLGQDTGGSATLDTFTSDYYAPGTWTQLYSRTDVPPGTRVIERAIRFNRRAGTIINFYARDMEFRLITGKIPRRGSAHRNVTPTPKQPTVVTANGRTHTP